MYLRLGLQKLAVAQSIKPGRFSHQDGGIAVDVILAAVTHAR